MSKKQKKEVIERAEERQSESEIYQQNKTERVKNSKKVIKM